MMELPAASFPASTASGLYFDVQSMPRPGVKPDAVFVLHHLRPVTVDFDLM